MIELDQSIFTEDFGHFIILSDKSQFLHFFLFSQDKFMFEECKMKLGVQILFR